MPSLVGSSLVGLQDNTDDAHRSETPEQSFVGTRQPWSPRPNLRCAVALFAGFWLAAALPTESAQQGPAVSRPVGDSKGSRPARQSTPGPLTNADVLQMVKAGLRESLIIKAVEANDTAFDTSASALIGLKHAGVAENIIDAMLLAARERRPSTPPTKPQEPPAVPRKTGAPKQPEPKTGRPPFVLPAPPVLELEPPPEIQLPQVPMIQFGDPRGLMGPPSDGPGSGAGIGSGSGGGAGQTKSGGRVWRVGGDVSAPVLLSQVAPGITWEAVRAGAQGVVELTTVIDENGLPTDIRVWRSLGFGLDEAAVRAVRQWRFRPAQWLGANSVPVEFPIAVSFHLPYPPIPAVTVLEVVRDRNRFLEHKIMVTGRFARYDSKLLYIDLDEAEASIRVLLERPLPEQLRILSPNAGLGSPLTHLTATGRLFVSRFGLLCLQAETMELERQVGSGGGIGSGSGGGVGSGTGPGVGPGRGGGIGGGAYRVDGGVSAPQLIHRVDPEYTEEARQAKHQGTVELYVEIEPDGKAYRIQVRRSLGLGLDEKAIECVRQWKFKPGLKDGRAVTVGALVTVHFRLL